MAASRLHPTVMRRLRELMMGYDEDPMAGENPLYPARRSIGGFLGPPPQGGPQFDVPGQAPPAWNPVAPPGGEEPIRPGLLGGPIASPMAPQGGMDPGIKAALLQQMLRQRRPQAAPRRQYAPTAFDEPQFASLRAARQPLRKDPNPFRGILPATRAIKKAVRNEPQFSRLPRRGGGLF